MANTDLFELVWYPNQNSESTRTRVHLGHERAAGFVTLCGAEVKHGSMAPVKLGDKLCSLCLSEAGEGPRGSRPRSLPELATAARKARTKPGQGVPT